jgi:hypothetical protein
MAGGLGAGGTGGWSFNPEPEAGMERVDAEGHARENPDASRISRAALWTR